MEDEMDAYVFNNEMYRDRRKVDEMVLRNAKLYYHDRVDPAVLEFWVRDAVAELWSDDVRVTRYIPTLALREVGARVAEAERGGPSSRLLTSTSTCTSPPTSRL
jgi:hypothetical protein